MNKIIYAVALNLLTFTTIAQINTDLRPQVKSPEVNKFEQYMNMPVNLVSGTPQVSVPIYTLEYGGMSLPITLEYDASGVKVESIASCVGQNWSLDVGGVVSRIVKSAPDEGNPYNWQVGNCLIDVDGYYQDYGLTKLESQLNLHPAQLYAGGNIDNRAIQWMRWRTAASNGLKDSQPDLFYFNTPQGSSKFVFNDQRRIVYLENTDFVVKENFLNNDFKSWDVTSPNGVKYKFGIDNATGYQGRGNACESSYDLVPDFFQGPGAAVNRFIVSSWFLTKISNFEGNQSIDLSYINNNYTHTVNNVQSKYTEFCHNSNLSNGIVSSPACNLNEEQQYNSFAGSATGNTTQNPRTTTHFVNSQLLNEITAGSVKIIFNYSLREDLINTFDSTGFNAKRLDKIEIRVNNICVKNFIFNYESRTSTEVVTNSAVTAECKERFFLKNFKEETCVDDKVKITSFIYNTTALPNRLSYAQDKWGYFNGKLGNPSLFASYRFLLDTSIYADRSCAENFAKAGILESIVYPTKGTVNFEYEKHSSYDVQSPINEPTDLYYDPVSSGNYVTEIQPTTPYSLDPSLNNNSTNSATFIYDRSDEAIFINSTLMFPHPMSNIASCGSYYSGSKAVEIIDSVTNQIVGSLSYIDVSSSTPKTIVSRKVVYPEDMVLGRTYICKVYGWGYYGHCLHNTTRLERHRIYPIYSVGGLRIKKIIHKNYDNSFIKQTEYNYFSPKVASNPKKVYKVENYNILQQFNSLSGILSGSNISYINIYEKGIANFSDWDFMSSHYYFISSGIDFFNFNFMGPNISYGKVIEINGTGNGKAEYNFNKYQSYLDLNAGEQFLMPSPPKLQWFLAGEKMSEILWTLNSVDLLTKRKEFNYNIINTSVRGINTLTPQNSSGAPLAPILNAYRLQGQTKTLRNETETLQTPAGIIETKKEYEYSSNHNNPIAVKTIDSKGQISETKMYYSTDLVSEPFMQSLQAQNRASTPIKTEKFVNGSKVYEQKTSFANDVSTSNLLQTKSVYAAKFPNAFPNIPNIGQLEKKVTTDLYDNAGNILQYTPDNGMSVCMIWGYNQTQPIAKLENINYSSLVPYIDNLQAASNTPNNEAGLLSDLQNLRNSFPNAMITTYTHKPLIGVSTITDPKGDIIKYFYDSMNRLDYVLDKNNNKLSENQYNYKQ